MSIEREWFIDGEKVDFRKVIKLAEEYDWKPASGIYLTSEASRILKQNGHKVECKEYENHTP